MTIAKKTLGLCWVALGLAFVWALMDLGKTYGGIRYLVHVDAGPAAFAALGCTVASAAIGHALFIRLAVRTLLTLAVGCVAAYVLAGVFSGDALLQLLMPPMIGRPLIWAYLLAAVLASVTLGVGVVRSGSRR